MEYLSAFAAGLLATLIFHQGLLAALHAAGVAPKPAFEMSVTAPLRVPAVISLAFWGGVWGIGLWLVLRDEFGSRYWMLAAMLGALGPSVVALFVVFPLKGQPAGAGGDRSVIARVFALNGAWGLGFALLMRLLLRQ